MKTSTNIYLLFLLIIFTCLSCTQSKNLGIYDWDKYNRNLSFVNHLEVSFHYKNQIREHMGCSFMDSNDVDNKNLSMSIKELIDYGTSPINHDIYNKFVNEVKRIRCINDNDIDSITRIEIIIYEKWYITEQYQLRSFAQIREYFIIHKYLFGNLNFVPYYIPKEKYIKE